MERRRLLGALGATGALVGLGPVLTACTASSSGGTTGAAASVAVSPTSSPQPTGPALPDPRVTAAAVESALVSYADRVLVRHPSTGAVVRRVRDGHAAHVVALVGTSPSPTPSIDGSGTSASATPGAPPLPATAAAALRALAGRERAAARAHATSALVVDAATARLLASLAAFSSANELVLTRSTV